MYLRFHRSKKILPGVRLNMSKSGPSVSLGVKGARLNVGPAGVRTTAGLPGTGLSAIQRQSWGKSGQAGRPSVGQIIFALVMLPVAIAGLVFGCLVIYVMMQALAGH